MSEIEETYSEESFRIYSCFPFKLATI